MVICSFFRRGMCHFGSECRNEHIAPYIRSPGIKPNEVRGIITPEAEAVLAGKQWIFSSFAPFRDKLCVNIPEFIEDLSPEEMRWECYQAKEQGMLPQYTNALSIKIQEATQKMQMLKSPSNEVICYLMDLYSGTVNASTKNPFNIAETGFGNTNLFTQTSNPVHTNIFGGASSTPFTSNNFGQTNIFNSQSQIASNNIFSNNNTNTFQQTNAFTNPVNNINGGFAQTNTNIFAQAASNFGQTSASATSAANAFSFAIPQTNTNIFGGNASGNNVFSLPNHLFGQTPNLNTNIFGTANSAIATNSNEQAAVFGQPSIPNNNIFAVANAAFQDSNTTSSNIFTTQNIGSPSDNLLHNSNNENVFGVQPTANVFESNTHNNAAAIFQRNSRPSVFESNAQSNNADIFKRNNQPNIFEFNAPNNAADVFQRNNQPTIFESNTHSNNADVFQRNGQSNDSDNPFFKKSNEKNERLTLVGIDQNAYSLLENLTPDQITSFQCNEFKLGSIPVCPPTLELSM